MQKPQLNTARNEPNANAKPHLKRIQSNTKGFGLVGILLVVLVLAAAAGAGVYAYHRSHKAKTVTTTTGTKTTTTTTKPASKPTPTPVDPYAGWKTYTDSTYHYSFRYPAGWTLDTSSAQSALGESGQVSLMNPAKTLQVRYVNSYAQDSSLVSFNTIALTKTTSASQDLTVVGGYFATSGLVGNYAPSYRVTDSSVLSAYPLSVGTANRFPSNPRFTDKVSSAYSGLLVSEPTTSINTVTDAQTWLASADAKTSLLILESLTYQP